LLAWNKAGQRFWKWVNMLRNAAGTVALDASTAGRIDASGNTVSNTPVLKMSTTTAGVHTYVDIKDDDGTAIASLTKDANDSAALSLRSGAGVLRVYLYTSGTSYCLLGLGIGTNGVGSAMLNVRGISTLGTISNTLWAANQTFPAGQLAGNAPYANVTSALARARAPQAVTYSGTNVNTDARLGGVYRVNATNDFRLHLPTGATDGQALKWWIKQHVGGTNTVTLVASEFVIPIGASTPVLSVTNGCVDVLAGEWDAVNSRVRVQSFMRYTE
jgi:hypothetical protein